MKNYILILFSLTFLMTNNNIFSQNTGSFDENINFNGEQRTISFYVPTDYDSTKTYNLLIGLHGLGDNSNNFRNALINYLSWDLIFPNTILAFPDGGNDPLKDFYTPEGDEQIIIQTINYCKENYNIDESNIILEGFSLGGRSALKFALDNPDIFKGIILNTPAIQGKMDAMNETAINFGFNYENAPKVKIAISYGKEDIIYVAPIKTMFDSLTKHNGIVYLQGVDGMQHNVASRIYIEELKNFIENPISSQNSIQILNYQYSNSVCDKNAEMKLSFRNSGANKISKVRAIITDGNSTFNKDINVDLSSFEFYETTIQFQPTYEGENNLRLFLNSVEGDNSLSYDSLDFNIWYYPDGLATPLIEDFESSEILTDDWEIVHGAAPLPFFPDDGFNSENSLFCFNSILLFYNLNTSEDIITPPLNITNLSTPTLYFDYSFNYHLYTPPYFTENTIFTDTLEIYLSTDCGNNWVNIYKKWGEDLSTYDQPIINPLQLDQIFPTTKKWKKEVIDLSDYQNSNTLKIKFSYNSGLGGAINIDNIAVDEFTGVYENISIYKIYPNPANDYVIINYENAKFTQLELINSIGQILFTQDITNFLNNFKLDISEFPSGFYTIRLTNNDKSINLKFIKK